MIYQTQTPLSKPFIVHVSTKYIRITTKADCLQTPFFALFGGPRTVLVDAVIVVIIFIVTKPVPYTF